MEVFSKVGYEIDSRDIEACHRLTNNNDQIIDKFSQRKDCNQVMSAKSDLQKVKLEEVGLIGGNLIFTNQSLCP